MKVKAILLKPLDGDPEGTHREFDQGDFDQLVKFGAVRKALPEPDKPEIPAAGTQRGKPRA